MRQNIKVFCTKKMFLVVYFILIFHIYFDGLNCQVHEHTKYAEHNAILTANEGPKTQVDDAHSHSTKKEYSHLLRIKRKEQSLAIKSVLQLKDPKKRQPLLKELVSKVKDVLAESKEVLDKRKKELHFHYFPPDEALRDNVARVIENAAFFGQLALYFPDFVHKLISKEPDFSTLYGWAHSFSSNFSVYDDSTSKMMHLAAQELMIIPREENYINPYSVTTQREQMQREALETMEKSKERKKAEKHLNPKKKRPGLSKSEL